MKKLTERQIELLLLLPPADEPGDGKRCRGPKLNTALSLVRAGFAQQLALRHFKRTQDGDAVVGLDLGGAT